MKISLTKVVAVFAVVALFVALSGCKDDGPSSKIYVKGGAEKLPRIAIIPFDAVGSVRSQDAGRVVTNTVITYLLSTGLFDVVDPGQVDDALAANQIRIGEGLKKADLQAIQKALNVDAVIIGLVEEYGDVRVGNDSYPSVSFSARLVNAHTGDIVWAGSVSKTGADKVTVFDIGRISSMGKLCKAAVQSMAASMSKTYDRVKIALADTGPAETVVTNPPGAVATTPAPQTTVTPTDTASTVVATTTEAATTVTTTNTEAAATTTTATPAAGKSTDVTKTYSEDDLRALLPDVPGFTKGDFDYSSHANPTLDGRYNLTGGKQFVEVKLVDYRKSATADSYVQMSHPGEDSVKFAGQTAFIKNSNFGYEHVDFSVGRFALFVRGPASRKDDVERAASAIAAAIK